MISVPYDDLAGLVGRELGTSEWISVDQQMIDAFADATGDYQWIHVDRDRAEREIGGTIAHGFLTLSLIPRLGDPMLEVAGIRHRLNYGLDRVRFTSPVPAGSRVRLVQTVADAVVREGGSATILHIDSTIEIEGADRPACIARQLVQFVRA
ncbi:MaoC family dehydratase [Rhodobacteraceae bacterium NNCM2]|nr:MaoC family dehydratase [Coraliihabitans acroporae]